jgi:acyl carrier protein
MISGSFGRYRLDPQASDEVGERLVALVRRSLGADASLPQPFPVGRQLSDLGLSSLKMVNLMLAVELEFDIAIPQSDITPENFHSVATIQALVVRTLSLRKPV